MQEFITIPTDYTQQPAPKYPPQVESWFEGIEEIYGPVRWQPKVHEQESLGGWDHETGEWDCWKRPPPRKNWKEEKIDFSIWADIIAFFPFFLGLLAIWILIVLSCWNFGQWLYQ